MIREDLDRICRKIERKTGKEARLWHHAGRWGVTVGNVDWSDKTKRGLRCYLEGVLEGGDR